MLDPLVTGLVVGGGAGAAGIAWRGFRILALVGAGALVWVVVDQGLPGVEYAVPRFLETVLMPHGRLLLGVVIGAMLGQALVRHFSPENR